VIGYLGIDIGGTKVALRYEDDLRVPREASHPWPDSEYAAQDLCLLARWAGELVDPSCEPITSVGVALPATVDPAGAVVAWPSRPSWVGLDVEAALRSLFPDVPMCFADDGELAALAEAREANCADVVYLGVGTGVGGGIVLDGRLWPGFARASCELGHMVVDMFGAMCNCGRRGCVQAVASGPATLRWAARTRGTDVSSDDLREALGMGEQWAVSAIERSCAALAAAIVSAGELYHPSLVLVGGGFATAMPGFVDTVADQVSRLARPGHPPAPVRPAVLGGLSSLYGAVLAAREAVDVRANP